MAKKPDDDWVTPLCPDHHLNGPDAQHSGNELEFWERHGINPFALCLSLRRAFLNEDQAAALEILRSTKEAAGKARKEGKTHGSSSQGNPRPRS